MQGIESVLLPGENIMFSIENYLGFILVGVLLNLTPGADTVYILTRSVAQGKKAGIASVLGINTGCLIHYDKHPQKQYLQGEVQTKLSALIHNYGDVLAVIFFHHGDTEDTETLFLLPIGRRQWAKNLNLGEIITAYWNLDFLYAPASMIFVCRRLPANKKNTHLYVLSFSVVNIIVKRHPTMSTQE
jgi:hypothetical protein